MTDILLIIAVVFCACALAASLAALKGLSGLRRENERAAKIPSTCLRSTMRNSAPFGGSSTTLCAFFAK